MGGIVDKHHCHGGGAIRKAFQHVFPDVMHGPVGAGIRFPVVFQGCQGFRGVDSDLAFGVEQLSSLLKQTGQKFTGAYHHVADGYRRTILHGGSRIEAAGEKACNSIVVFKALWNLQFPPVGFKIHSLVGGVAKQIPPVKHKLCAGIVGDADALSVDGGIAVSELRQRLRQQTVPVKGDLAERPKQLFSKLVHPGHIHPDQIIPSAAGGLDHLVDISQGREHRQFQMDPCALFQMRQQAFQRCGGRGRHREHPQV